MCEIAKVYSEWTVTKTRKDHKCCECRQVIPRGSACKTASGIWEYIGAKTFRWCLACDVLRQEAVRLLGCNDDGIGFGELHEFIAETR